MKIAKLEAIEGNRGIYLISSLIAMAAKSAQREEASARDEANRLRADLAAVTEQRDRLAKELGRRLSLALLDGLPRRIVEENGDSPDVGCVPIDLLDALNKLQISRDAAREEAKQLRTANAAQAITIAKYMRREELSAKNNCTLSVGKGMYVFGSVEATSELEDTLANLKEKARIAEASEQKLRREHAATMGVGTGDTGLFIHGSYEAIKAAQAISDERQELRGKYRDALGRLQAANKVAERAKHILADFVLNR